MKKTGLLLLLTPTLFLASCQTTPKINALTEEEAQAFIKEHFTKTEFATPSNQSLVKWKITKDNEEGYAKTIIGKYIFNDKAITDQDGNKGVTIENDRCAQYVGELNLEDSEIDFGIPGQDAVIGMNWAIYQKLYLSGQHDIELYTLVYKPAGKGLTISSESAVQHTIYTRTHYYNENGQETKFEINANKNNSTIVFTMSIEFKY